MDFNFKQNIEDLIALKIDFLPKQVKTQNGAGGFIF
jgi:hypothetical protein